MQADCCEFEAKLVCIKSSRHRETLSQKEKFKKKEAGGEKAYFDSWFGVF